MEKHSRLVDVSTGEKPTSELQSCYFWGGCGCTALDFSHEPLFRITRAEACSEGRHSCGTNTFGFIELPSSCNGNHPKHRR